MTYATRIRAVPVLGIAIALVASCGGESSDESVGVDTPSATDGVNGQ
jgi:hypothetical protein